MMVRTCEVSDIAHATPCWAREPDGRLTEQIQALLVDQRIAGWIDEASSARALPRRRAALRSRLGHAISGLGEWIAGQDPKARVA